MSFLKENEECYRILDALFNPRVHLHRLDSGHLSRNKELLHEWNDSGDQDDPEVLKIKEEEEEKEIWINEMAEQAFGLEDEIINNQLTEVDVKNEDSGVADPPTSGSVKEIELKETQKQTSNQGPNMSGKISTSSQNEVSDHEDGSYEEWQIPLSDAEAESKDSDSGHEMNRGKVQNKFVKVDQKLESQMRGCTKRKKSNCDVCGNRFTWPGSLKTHMRIHTGDKPFGCDVCGKKFTQRGNLKIHMRVHTGEKPFGCDVCGKRFTRADSLKTHMRVHTGEKLIDCDVCGKRFVNHYLKTHMRVHTGEKPFGCEVCGNRFTQPNNLKRHMQVHTGEKPFGCDVCGKRFTRPDSLKTHMRVHTGEKPFGCDVCGKV